VEPDGIALAFNAAHTRGLVTCAVALADAVGVDLEHPSDRDRTFEIAQRVFSEAEVDALRSMPPEVRDDRFFDYWTLKEAYVKGRGMGLSLPFDQCTIDLSDRSSPTVAVAPEFDDGCRWQFQLATLSTGHRLAAAVRLPASGKAYKFRSHIAVPFASPVMGQAGLINPRRH
jgi:4'-phosphopantetheinyl transferase